MMSVQQAKYLCIGDVVIDLLDHEQGRVIERTEGAVEIEWNENGRNWCGVSGNTLAHAALLSDIKTLGVL